MAEPRLWGGSNELFAQWSAAQMEPAWGSSMVIQIGGHLEGQAPGIPPDSDGIVQ